MIKYLIPLLFLNSFIYANTQPEITATSSFNGCEESSCVVNLNISIKERGYVISNASIKESSDLHVIYPICDNSNECLIMIRTSKEDKPIHVNLMINGESREFVHTSNTPKYYNKLLFEESELINH